MSVDLADYRARRARLGLNDNAVPLVMVPADAVPEPAAKPGDRADDTKFRGLFIKVKPALPPSKKKQPKVSRFVDVVARDVRKLEAIEQRYRRGELLSALDAPEITHAVAEAHGIKIELMKLNGVGSYVVSRARHHWVWALKRYLRLSFPRINDVVKYKDHTGCVYAWERHQLRVENGDA